MTAVNFPLNNEKRRYSRLKFWVYNKNVKTQEVQDVKNN